MKKVLWILVVILILAGIGGYLYWDYRRQQELKYPKFYSGNGRLEATEVFVAAKQAGRVEKIFVKEGDIVRRGDKLVQMQTDILEAQKAATEARIKVQEGELAMARATVQQKESAFKGAEKEYLRNKQMLTTNAVAKKAFDVAETEYFKATADLEYAKAGVIAAEGKLAEQKAELLRLEHEIRDSLLVASYEGRVQYLIAHEGEVLSAGGRAITMVDLTDVYMTFFLPTQIAGQLQMDAEVKLIFDAAPDYPIDARVKFIDPVAQFTPKSVETKVEREKLMFRVKAKIDPALLRQYIDQISTGLPGVAWVKLDPNADWKDSPVPMEHPSPKADPVPEKTEPAPATAPAPAKK